ncbi:MAG: hypothetical protein HFF36_12475 [Coprobacillus sp.]|nr:hypothetical protein [Coprobacillus sp.]
MFKNTSKLIKISAYIFLIGHITEEIFRIAVNTSYLRTGRLLGTQSMLSMLWACFISFLISLIIYGIGIVIEFYEKKNASLAEGLTKSSNDVK